MFLTRTINPATIRNSFLPYKTDSTYKITIIIESINKNDILLPQRKKYADFVLNQIKSDEDIFKTVKMLKYGPDPAGLFGLL